MIPHGLEDALDGILERGSSATNVGAAIARLPSDLRRQVEMDSDLRCWMAERIALHTAIQRLGGPMPSAGFADRVVAAARVQRASNTWSVRIAWGAGFAVAAGLIIATLPPLNGRLVEVPKPARPEPAVVTPTAVALHFPTPTDFIRDAMPSSSVESSPKRLPGVSPDLPPIGPRLRSSTETLWAAAGRQVGDRVKPVASSVGGAFSFVFDMPAVEKRSL